MLTLDKIFNASVVLKDIVRKTPLVAAPGIAPGCELYLKPENLQNTGSFKLRGSGYMIAQLSDEEKADIENAEETFESLFGYFNTLVSPAEEVQEESGSGANVLSTVIATAIGILLAQKIITKRNLRN